MSELWRPFRHIFKNKCDFIPDGDPRSFTSLFIIHADILYNLTLLTSDIYNCIICVIWKVIFCIFCPLNSCWKKFPIGVNQAMVHLHHQRKLSFNAASIDACSIWWLYWIKIITFELSVLNHAKGLLITIPISCFSNHDSLENTSC